MYFNSTVSMETYVHSVDLFTYRARAQTDRFHSFWPSEVRIHWVEYVLRRENQRLRYWWSFNAQEILTFFWQVFGCIGIFFEDLSIQFFQNPDKTGLVDLASCGSPAMDSKFSMRPLEKKLGTSSSLSRLEIRGSSLRSVTLSQSSRNNIAE